MDPRTPVIVGTGIENHFDSAATHELPVHLMVAAADAALDEALGLRGKIEWVRVPWGVWPYRDPGRLVADRIGTSRARTTKTTVGGNQVYDLLVDSAHQIANGRTDAVLVCGAETQRTRVADRRAGRMSNYLTERPDAVPDETFGSEQPLSTEAEDAVGVAQPVVYYALAESALRHRNTETVPGHRRRIAELWAQGAEVAVDNPHAWLRTAPTADDIETVSEANRPITAPYTKLMTSNNMVNQSGAFVMCSAELAESVGIPRDRWVFPWSGLGAHDTAYVTNRWALDESPAMRLAGRRTLNLSGLDADDCAYLDLYSCFPAAVQVAQRELGIDSDRGWTVSGGLTFAAGPLNCYCLLPLVRAVELLRETPDERAFLTGNGGYFTKHSFVVLAGRPPSAGFLTDDVQSDVDALPTRETPVGPAKGSTTIEAHTVVYDRNGVADHAIVSSLDDSGGRHFTRISDSDVVADLEHHDRVGTALAARTFS